MSNLGVCPRCGEPVQGGYCQNCGPARPDYRPRWRFSVCYSSPNQAESTRVVESHAELLDDVLAAMDDFLKAAGFALDGHLDVVPPR